MAQHSVQARPQQPSIPNLHAGGLELYWKHTWQICEPPIRGPAPTTGVPMVGTE